METFARSYLKNLSVQEHYVTGFIESDEEYKQFLRDLDTRTGGFVKKWTRDNEEKDEGIVFIFLSFTYVILCGISTNIMKLN